MSASREKKKRQEQYATGTLSRTEEKVSSFKPIYILYIFLAVVFFAILIFVTMYNNGFFASHATAYTVGGHKVSAATYKIYYQSLYDNYYNTYSDYIENYGYPFSADEALEDQVYDDTTGETWADYFDDMAKESMVWVYTMTDAAKEEGFTLSESSVSTIDATLESIASTAETNGYSSTNGFLAAYYGTGVTEKLYRSFLELQYLASEYQTEKEDSFTCTTEDLDNYYAENYKDFDKVSFSYYYVDGSAESTTETDEETGEETTIEPTEEESAAAMAAAEETSAALLAQAENGLDAFAGYAYYVDYELPTDDVDDFAAVPEGDDYESVLTEQTDYSYTYATYLSEEIAEWLFSGERTEGDVSRFETASGYYVVYFSSYNNNDYTTVNVRHILIEPEDVEDITDDDGNVDEEATAEAEEAADAAAAEKAQEIYDEYLAGGQTEDEFSQLAVLNSEDSNASEGGLYENVYKGQMVENFENWIYDPARQPGDTDIVTTDYGYHIVYFVGEGENYKYSLLEDAYLQAEYDNWYDETSAAYEVAENDFGMRFI